MPCVVREAELCGCATREKARLLRTRLASVRVPFLALPLELLQLLAGPSGEGPSQTRRQMRRDVLGCELSRVAYVPTT